MKAWCAAAMTALLTACSVGDDLPDAPSIAFDFHDGELGWVAGFADYPVGEETNFELVHDYRALPAEAGPGSALYIAGNNHSDDLFMFYKRRVDGFIAGHVYKVRLGADIVTSAPHGCAGIGGSPGESVWLKAGASTIEPQPVADQENTYRMNVDKGNQADGGADAIVLGTIDNGLDCADAPQFKAKHFASSTEELTVAADPTGAIWFFVGTDSGFEGTTEIYYTGFSVDVIP